MKLLNPGHTDSRGSITDIFVNDPKDHCCLITFTSGAIRANHFHKRSTQYSLITQGELEMAVCRVDEDGNFIEEPKICIVKPLTLITHSPYIAHAFRALTPSVMLAFADGIRGGDSYEHDVYRLDNLLLK